MYGVNILLGKTGGRTFGLEKLEQEGELETKNCRDFLLSPWKPKVFVIVLFYIVTVLYYHCTLMCIVSPLYCIVTILYCQCIVLCLYCIVPVLYYHCTCTVLSLLNTCNESVLVHPGYTRTSSCTMTSATCAAVIKDLLHCVQTSSYQTVIKKLSQPS